MANQVLLTSSSVW